MQTHPPRERRLIQNPEALRRRRVLAGKSKLLLAQEIGISPTHMSNIELGKRSVSEELLHRLAKAFDCPVEELMAEELGSE